MTKVSHRTVNEHNNKSDFLETTRLATWDNAECQEIKHDSTLVIFVILQRHHFSMTGLLFFKFFTTWGSLSDLSSPTRYQTVPPSVEVWTLNHWTWKEVPNATYLLNQILSNLGAFLILKSFVLFF